MAARSSCHWCGIRACGMARRRSEVMLRFLATALISIGPLWTKISPLRDCWLAGGREKAPSLSENGSPPEKRGHQNGDHRRRRNTAVSRGRGNERAADATEVTRWKLSLRTTVRGSPGEEKRRSVRRTVSASFPECARLSSLLYTSELGSLVSLPTPTTAIAFRSS